MHTSAELARIQATSPAFMGTPLKKSVCGILLRPDECRLSPQHRAPESAVGFGNVNFSSFPSGYTPYFNYTLTVNVGFTPYYYQLLNNIQMHSRQNAIPSYYHSQTFTIDLYITVGSILTLNSNYYSPGATTSFETHGWFTGYLISE